MTYTMGTDTKVCRQCHMDIPAAARRCGHCGSDYRGAVENAFRGVLIAGLAVTMLIVAIVAYGLATH